MTSLCSELLARLEGKTLVTAESLTGGGIGAALTAVPGASRVYRGGIISYCDEVKHSHLGVSMAILENDGAVSYPAAVMMAVGARNGLQADVALSVTGLAGPDGDAFGHPVGTVFVGYSDEKHSFAREFHFFGDREQIRSQTIRAAVELALEQL